MENLALSEFWKLPKEQWEEAYDRLSTKDQLVFRCSFDGTSYEAIPCNDCKHRIEKKLACKAYPDGLSGEIIRKKAEDPFGECRNGFFYERR